jgi:hypothetical protein
MSESASTTLLILWLAWAVGTSLALRHLLALGVKRLLPAEAAFLVGICVLLAVIVIFFGSILLHEAVWGSMAIHGARAEAFSMIVYMLAPFGLPLLIGSLLLLPYDLTNCIIPPRCWIQ